MRLLALLAAVGLVVAGGAGGWLLARGTEETETVVTTTTATTTETESVAETGLPPEVDETRRAILVAAASGDYEALRQHIPGTGFSYTFGGPVEGGPIAYWRELERQGGDPPLETLAEILRMPYTLAHGIYVWPWVYSLTDTESLTAHGRELLAPLGKPGELFVPGTGYLGWRAGIEPDGTWVFFVAGD